MRRHEDHWGRGTWHQPAASAGNRRRWQRWVSGALPVAAVGVLVFSLVVATGGAGAASSPAAKAPRSSLASLLLPGTDAGGHGTAIGSNAVRSSAAVTYGAAAHQPSTAHVKSEHRGETYRNAPSEDIAMVPSTQLVAHLEHSTPGYPSANALQSNRKVPGSWYGYPSILPVIAQRDGKLKVRLAQRPDEATTWIKQGAAVITRTHWAILVDLSQHFLYVFHYGIEQASFPVGNGAPNTPTPTGTYFVAFHAPPNGPGYGSVMLETSAHSKVYRTFEGGTDAIIAIHGPVGSDALIGNHGAAISNGCIRMHDWDLNQVKHVPNGAPVILTY